jgi:hypothetical protein
VLRHRLARITRIAQAILKATASLALVSLASPAAALPSASSLPISLPAHVALLLLFFYSGVGKSRQGSYPEATESRPR